MTGDEHQAQEVVADVIVHRGLKVRRSHLKLGLDLATDFLVLALEQRSPAQQVDRTMLRGGHEPGARVVRDARLRPPLERGDSSRRSGPPPAAVRANRSGRGSDPGWRVRARQEPESTAEPAYSPGLRPRERQRQGEATAPARAGVGRHVAGMAGDLALALQRVQVSQVDAGRLDRLL